METLAPHLFPLPAEGVTVVIPTRNEAKTLGAMLQRTARSLESLDVPAEIIVVDDASPDGTADVAEAAVLPVPVRVIRRRARPSLSLSVIEGARAARYSSVAVLDADLSHAPEDLPRVLEPVLSVRAEVALGSRYVPGGSVSEWPRRRRLLSRLGARLARAVTRVRDPLSGFFATRRELLDGSAVRLRPRGYKILLEVLARAPGIRVEEVPIRFKDRVAGESKLGLRAEVAFLAQLFLLLLSRAGFVNQARLDHPGERRRGASLQKPQDRKPTGDPVMKKVLLIALVVGSLSIALVIYLSEKPLPEAVGQVQVPQIVLYTGENFTGRELLVEGTVFDLPREEDGDGSLFDWNDNVRSLIVVSGTWRLYENGRCNTQLDDTRLESFDIRGKSHVQGWSALVSATSAGRLEIPNLAAGGLGEDLSSIELISQANLPDWVFAFRNP